MQEIWKDIKGYEKKYQISNLGNVKSLNYKRTFKEKVLSPSVAEYKTVTLCKNAKPKMHYIHRLVAEAFIENKEKKPWVNHKDGNKHNNIITNLEWCTAVENINHAIVILGKNIKPPKMLGIKNPRATKIKCIETGEIFDMILDASQKYNVSMGSLSRAIHSNGQYTCNKKHWVIV